jgi:hypothetical protein
MRSGELIAAKETRKRDNIAMRGSEMSDDAEATRSDERERQSASRVRCERERVQVLVLVSGVGSAECRM